MAMRASRREKLVVLPQGLCYLARPSQATACGAGG
jgi:hypothetical protein